MTKVSFLDSSTIEVIVPDGEKFKLSTYQPVPNQKMKFISSALSKSFDENFSDDKSSMIYWVLMGMMANEGFSFSYVGSDRSAERERIGSKIRLLREKKGIEAKHLALMINIDAANLCRIEQGKYSVGLDILTKISDALGVKVDLV